MILSFLPIVLLNHKSKQKSPAHLYKAMKYRKYGDKGNRTPDLLNANQTLYHLSYTPEKIEN